MTDTRQARRRQWRWGLSSLKGRLLALAAVVLLVGLSLFAMQLTAMFRVHVERNARAMLNTHLEQLVVALQRQPQGAFRTTVLLPDPRFLRPLSGYYWQILDESGRPVARSRSLWDSMLPPPPLPLPSSGPLHYHVRGPGEEMLLVVARRLLVERGTKTADGTDADNDSAGDAGGGTARALTFMVAARSAEIEQAVQAFNRELIVSLVVLALVLLTALLAQVWLGLRPLEKVRRQLAAVRKGKARTLQAPDIEEVRGLVEELDKLLQAQHRHMEQARARAGNLAHGLKTPLAALAALARDMIEDGQTQRARAVLHQVSLLRQHVQRELSRGRARGSGSVAREVWLSGVVQRLLRTLRTLREGEKLHWQVDVPGNIHVRMEEGDLLELAGNLLDNAAKWASTTVRISAAVQQGSVLLQVEDDGPGVPAAQRQRIVERGVRLDEQKPGSGLGLAIVQEIVESYGGELRLDDSPLGGLRVSVRLPQGDGEMAADG